MRRWSGELRGFRWIVLAVALSSSVLKLVIASQTFGTNDVHYWTEFADGVRKFGPVGVYGHSFSFEVYNHPPLAGWMLSTINFLTDRGLDLPFLIRVPASVADVGTALLLFEILRRRVAVREATAASVLFSISPLMVIVSGFHGNTDAVFVFASVLTLYLIAMRGHFVRGGIAFGLAVSIKLVPVVLAPLLLVLLVRRGLAPTVRFAAGGLAVFLVLWVPVLVLRGPEFVDQVLGYSGIGLTEWGVPEFLKRFGISDAHVGSIRDHSRLPVLLAASLVPAMVVWRRPEAWVMASGLSFCIFLLLSPAFGMQYLVWALAPAYLVNWQRATAYNAAASVFAYAVYAHWSGNVWWHWYEARATPFSRGQLVLMTVTWSSLLLMTVGGLLDTMRRVSPSPGSIPASEPQKPQSHHPY